MAASQVVRHIGAKKDEALSKELQMKALEVRSNY